MKWQDASAVGAAILNWASVETRQEAKSATHRLRETAPAERSLVIIARPDEGVHEADEDEDEDPHGEREGRRVDMYSVHPERRREEEGDEDQSRKTDEEDVGHASLPPDELQRRIGDSLSELSRPRCDVWPVQLDERSKRNKGREVELR